MAPIRDILIGRLRLPTMMDTIAESLGDSIEVTGSSVTASERRARPFPIKIRVRGAGDADLYAASQRLRRQARSYFDNPLLLTQGVFLRIAFDPEQNGWVVFSGADLAYGKGGITVGDYTLELRDPYRVGQIRTHRPGRRVSILDRTSGLVARDILGRKFSTDFTTVGPQAGAVPVIWLPDNVSDVALGRVPVSTTVTEGKLQVGRSIVGQVLTPSPFPLPTTPDRATLSFEPANEREMARNPSDVILYDRRGNVTPTIDYAGAKNLLTNPDAQGTLAGSWTPSASADVTFAETTQDSAPAFLLRRDSDGGGAQTIYMQATPGMPNVAGKYVAIACEVRKATPSAARSASISLHGNSTATISAGVGVALSDVWQRLVLPAVVLPAPDATINMRVNVAAAAEGEQFYVRRVILAAGNTAADATANVATYGDGDDDDFVWATTAHASITTPGAPEEALYGWEEVFGPNYPLTAGDMPVMQNGLCRVRLTNTTGTPVFAVDRWVDSAQAWITVGTISPSQLQSPLVGTIRARIVESTPERAVINIAGGGQVARTDIYITLQRGWQGPRFEAYVTDFSASDNSSFTTIGFTFTPAQTSGTQTLAKNGAGTAVTTFVSTGGWAGVNRGSPGSYPWVGMQNSAALVAGDPAPRTVLMVQQAGVVITTQGAAAPWAVDLGIATGYVSVQMAFTADDGATWALAREYSRRFLFDVQTVPEVTSR